VGPSGPDLGAVDARTSGETPDRVRGTSRCEAFRPASGQAPRGSSYVAARGSRHRRRRRSTALKSSGLARRVAPTQNCASSNTTKTTLVAYLVASTWEASIRFDCGRGVAFVSWITITLKRRGVRLAASPPCIRSLQSVWPGQPERNDIGSPKTGHTQATRARHLSTSMAGAALEECGLALASELPIFGAEMRHCKT
jgi:hypothetical protein